MRLPDFFIVGAPKCGTSSLWAYLDAHPDICMCRPKEPKFFSREKHAAPRKNHGTYDRGFEWYARQFAHFNNEKCVGDASPGYLARESSPGLIAKHCPDAEIIMILRDPVDRVYSHFWYAKRRRYGTWKIRESFEEFVRKDNSLLHGFFKGSHYKEGIRRYLTHFPKEQIHFFFLEDFKRDPQALVDHVCEIVGVAPGCVNTTEIGNQNVAGVPRYPRIYLLAHRLNHIFLATRHLLPVRLEQRFQAMKQRVARTNRLFAMKQEGNPPLSKELRAELLLRFMPDIEYVEQLTGRDLSDWKQV